MNVEEPVFDFRHLEMSWRGKRFHMSRISLLLLECLWEGEPSPVTLPLIYRHVWRNRGNPNNKTISVYFCKLRHDLAGTGIEIHAVRGLDVQAWRIKLPPVAQP